MEDGGVVKLAAIPVKALKKTVKLGRREPTSEMRARVPCLSRFLVRGAKLEAPKTVDYGERAQVSLSRIYLNDQLGCCVISDAAHGLGVWSSADKSPELLPTDAEIREKYRSWCGPGDNGCYMIAVNERMVREGLKVGTTAQKIDGFVSVDASNLELLKWACYRFGGLSFGFACPEEYVTQARPGFVWDRRRGRIVGGHAVRIFGFNEQGWLVSTWGVTGVWKFDAFASDRLCDEVYAAVAPAWYGSDDADPNEINAAQLREELAAAGRGDIPPEPTPTPPTPTPTPGRLVLDGWVSVFGQHLPAHLEGEFANALARGGVGDWFVIAGDVAAIITALRNRDWVALALAVEKLLTDLGVTFGVDDVTAFTGAMRVAIETRVLDQITPPAGLETSPKDG